MFALLNKVDATAVGPSDSEGEWLATWLNEKIDSPFILFLIVYLSFLRCYDTGRIVAECAVSYSTLCNFRQ